MKAIILQQCPRCGGALFPPEDDPDLEYECLNCGRHKYRQAPIPKDEHHYQTRPSKYAA